MLVKLLRMVSVAVVLAAMLSMSPGSTARASIDPSVHAVHAAMECGDMGGDQDSDAARHCMIACHVMLPCMAPIPQALAGLRVRAHAALAVGGTGIERGPEPPPPRHS